MAADSDEMRCCGIFSTGPTELPDAAGTSKHEDGLALVLADPAVEPRRVERSAVIRGLLVEQSESSSRQAGRDRGCLVEADVRWYL